MPSFRPLLTTLAVACLIAPAGIPVACAADASSWTVDYAKSSITFVARQMRVPAEGRFAKFTADIRFDPENLAGSRADVVIDTSSAVTGNTNIDRELKRPKWFAVEQFPTARFVTGEFRSKGGTAYEAAAKLTMRDVTDDVVLPFSLEIEDGVARAKGELRISRTKFGIGQGEWTDTNIVADEVVIRIEIVARRGG